MSEKREAERAAYTSKEERREVLIRARTVRAAILDHPADPPAELDTLLDQARAGAHDQAVSILLSARAFSRRVAGRQSEARSDVDDALAAAELANDPAEIGWSLVTRAMIRVEGGDLSGARLDLDAAPATGAIDARLALAGGVVAHHAGEVVRARRLFEAAAADSTSPRKWRAVALNNLADILRQEDPRAALRTLEAARQMLGTEDSDLVGFLDSNTGLALAEAGEIGPAMALLESVSQAVSLREGGIAAEFDTELSAVLGRLRLLGEARAAASRGLRGLEEHGRELILADALVAAARLAVADGDKQAARAYLDQALETYKRQSRPAGVAVAAVESLALQENPPFAEIAGHAATLTSLGLEREGARAWIAAADAAAAAGEVDAAQSHWTEVTRMGGADPITIHLARARLALTVGDHSAAHREVAAAQDRVDARASLARAPDLRYRIAAERAAFEQLDRVAKWNARPAARLDAILQGRPPGARPTDADPVTEGLRLQWRELSARVESAREDAATLVTLSAQLADTERRLRTTSWGADGGGRGRRPDGLSDLLSELAGSLLVVARVGGRAVAYRAEPRVNVAFADLGSWASVREDFDQLARGLSRMAVSRSQGLRRACHALAADVEARFDNLLAGEGEVLILVDRGLESAPFTALPALWRRPLTVGSLAVTAAGRPSAQFQPVGSQRRVVIAVGPRLDNAAVEATRVAGVWGGASTVSTADALVGHLPTADIVHVAAHATLRWDNPLQSPVHLDDGPLAMAEITERTSAADRVRPMELLVLAACSLATAPADEALVGAIPMLTEHAAKVVVASSIPMPDQHGPWIAHAVHAIVERGGSAAAGLLSARSAVRVGDPEQSDAWAALCCLTAYSSAP